MAKTTTTVPLWPWDGIPRIGDTIRLENGTKLRVKRVRETFINARNDRTCENFTYKR